MLMTTDPGDLILDPTCGSGTTAHVAEQWGRRWITMDTSRVALSLARTRIMTARFPYYLLADSPEGQKKEAELLGRACDLNRAVPTGDIRQGFVYKRVPHVTLKSIAHNEEIDSIHAAYQKKLEPLREQIQQAGEAQLEGMGGSALGQPSFGFCRRRNGEQFDDRVVEASVLNGSAKIDASMRAAPTLNCSSISHMKIQSACASPARSPSKVFLLTVLSASKINKSSRTLVTK